MTSESTDENRVAVVGMGYWGKNLVRNFHDIGALAAICDSDASIEDICRQNYAGIPFVSDFARLLPDTTIRAVALATPAARHFAMVKSALLAGKDVFVEKPLALNVKEGQELVRSLRPRDAC